jgi:hypothetical protein
MKKTLIIAAIFSMLTQITVLQSAKADEILAEAPKVSKILSLAKAWKPDTHFVSALMVMGIAGPIIDRGVLPHLIKGLCALESKTIGKGSFFLGRDCDLYYGDPKSNSCQVANDGVALMLPFGEKKGQIIRFVGIFRGQKLHSIVQSLGVLNRKKEFQPSPDLPVEVIIDEDGYAVEFRPTPGSKNRLLKSQAMSEDEADTFLFYDQVAAVMRLAFTECRDGKYDAMMKDILKRHGGKMPAGTKK